DYRVPLGGPPASIFGLNIPPGWGLNLYSYITSGEAYTPRDSEGRQSGEDYSSNGPYETAVNMKLTKALRVGRDRTIELILQGWNIFNRRNATEVDPQTGEPYTPGVGTMVQRDSEFYRILYSNPAYWGAPRTFRLAVAYEW
ncbi:MAG: hypothetical protein V2A71_02785, partial [Candidatus Eisenbacteria bacterium]